MSSQTPVEAESRYPGGKADTGDAIRANSLPARDAIRGRFPVGLRQCSRQLLVGVGVGATSAVLAVDLRGQEE